ncbi:MAG: glutamate 5-kinase [Candidatus Nanopelagicales bacterium]
MTDAAQARSAVREASRIVIKIGSSSLTTPEGQLDKAKLIALVDTAADLVAQGKQVVLVSSGAIASGLGPMGLSHRPRELATQQAVASVGQGILLASYSSEFGRHGIQVGQVLLTADDVDRRAHYRNARQTLAQLLELGVVPVVNENDTVATNEIRFGDNDRLAALVAHIVEADALILLSDTDSLYDRHPSDPDAKAISVVASSDRLEGVDIGGPGSGVGSGGMKTKVEAARIAGAAGIPVVLTSAAQADVAVSGDEVGTIFLPKTTRSNSRLLWLKYATEAQGRLVLDDGAVNALTRSNASLLAVGVTAVEGEFSAGDPVDFVDSAGRVIGRGLSNFDANEVPAMLGKSSSDLLATLGPEYERELIHRDDLVLFVG